MNEANTRAEYIEPALRAAGWGVVEGSRIHREYVISQGRLQGSGGRRAKAEIADFVLIYKNQKLAVIEAKALSLPYTEGVAQAKSYAMKLAVRYTYATNGQKIYGIDLHETHGSEGDVNSFPTPDELWNRTFPHQSDWRDNFAAVPYEDKGGYWGSRFYQDIAINRVLEAVADKKQRILLTLATGTGKTAIAFQIAWKLFHSRWNLHRDGNRRPRILFLADRNILADQAYNAFSSFKEDALVRIAPGEIKKKGKVPKNGNIFFTIFQTFMSGPVVDGKPTPYFGEYPPDFFDFIVIDECHRGGANDESTWRDILKYFSPAVQLGLTATPKRKDNIDTYDYFGEPVYKYSLKEGINDGYLTPFKVRQISTTLDEYIYTPDDDVEDGEIEVGRVYKEGDINRIIEIPEREKYRIRLFMQAINQKEKTLIFCANQAHALTVRDYINQIKSSKDPNYCVRVSADDGDRGEQFLRDFQDNEKNTPIILTTSHKLSTGVDARNVRNIVLMREIKSMIEFKQIIGRGTRTFDGKDYFTIYDFVKAHQHFLDPEWDGEPIDNTSEPSTGEPIDKVKEKDRTEDFDSHDDPEPVPFKRIRVTLKDGKVREIQSMMSTTFWSADGVPMTAEDFLKSLFGTLPALFKDESALREIWSKPDTRKALLESLGEHGFTRDQLSEMQRLIDAERSDLYDVLAYVAFATPTVTRAARSHRASMVIEKSYDKDHRLFLEFVLAQYVIQGVDELDYSKLAPLLTVNFGGLHDASLVLGDMGQIRTLFTDFQPYLYDYVQQTHNCLHI